MKNKLLIIFLLFVFITPMSAQINSLLEDANMTFPNAIDNSLVRNYQDQYAVGYILDGNTPYFYSTSIEAFSDPYSTLPFSNGNILQGIPNAWRIYDLKIESDLVFFCGTDGSGCGLYGFFFINDLVIGSGLINIYCFSLQGIDELSRMVVFKRNGIWSIVGIGKTILQNSSVDCIVDIPVIGGGQFDYSPLYNPNNNIQETLQDVHLVGRYVVFVGMKMFTGGSQMYLRRSYANNVFGSPEINNVYLYTPYPGTQEFILGPQLTSSTTIENNFVAVAHQCTDETIREAEIVISLIDAANTMNIVSTQKYINKQRVFLKEMVFVPDSLFLVLPHVGGNLPFGFLVTKPFMSGAYSTSLILTTDRYTSIELLNTQSFISVGKSKWFLQRLFSLAMISNCLDVTDVPIKTTGYQKNVITSVPYVPAGVEVSYPVNATVTPINLQVNCEKEN